VKVIATHLATLTGPATGHSGGVVGRLLRKVVPAANPDFDDLYRNVRLWWVEVDDNGAPQREVGFGSGNQVLMVGPLEENMGFWTDSPMVFNGPEYEQVESAAFEAYWARFVATWYAKRARKRDGQ
jgi:hypothetical protein